MVIRFGLGNPKSLDPWEKPIQIYDGWCLSNGEISLYGKGEDIIYWVDVINHEVLHSLLCKENIWHGHHFAINEINKAIVKSGIDKNYYKRWEKFL